MIPSRRKKGSTHGHERSSSWAFGGLRRVNSTSSLITPSGVSGGLPASSSRTIDMFVIEELCARSGNVVFGPKSVFQGNVIMGAKTTLNNAAVSITFQGIGQNKEINAAFLTVTEELWRGDITPGRHSFLFGLQFPSVNLPPSSDEPGIMYNFVAKVSYGTDFHVAFVSKPFQIKFVPLIDPFAKPRASISEADAAAEKTPKDGKKPSLKIDTAAATTPKRMSAYGLSGPGVDSSNTVTVITKDDDGTSVASELRVKMPHTLFLPGDEITASLKLAIPKRRELPKMFTARVEEVRRFVIEQSGKDVQKTAEVVKNLSSQKLPLSWEAAKRETTTLSLDPQSLAEHARASMDDSTPKPAPSQDAAQQKDSDANNTSTSNNRLSVAGGTKAAPAVEAYVMRTTVHIRLPNFHSFVANSYLPSSRLPLTGAPDSASTPKTPTASNKSRPPPQGGQGVSMDISHRLHITIHMPSARIALKKPTVELYAPITLGNRDPKDSKRPHRNGSTPENTYPAAKTSGNRRNSSSTNPSFLLTTAPDDSFYPAESPGSGKSKVPSFRLNSFSEEGESSAAGAAGSSSSIGGRNASKELLSGSAIWDMPGSPVWMEVRNPEDGKDEAMKMLTLAETSERPFFLKNES